MGNTGPSPPRARPGPRNAGYRLWWYLGVAWLLGGSAGCRLLAERGPTESASATCQARSQEAAACMQRDDWRQAEQLLAEAIRQDPTSTQARRYYAETLWHRKAFDRAVVEMETAMRLDRCDPHAAVRAGQMRLTLGHVDKARLHADQAVQRDPQLAAAWQLRGQVVSAAGDTERALADFHRALDLESDNRAVLWHVAELYRLRNQPHRALSTLQHLADTYVPGEEPSQVFYWQGLACAALGRHDDAVDCLQTASRRGESTADVWYQLAEVQLRAGRPAAADQALRQALARDAQHEPSRILLGQLNGAGTGAAAVRRR